MSTYRELEDENATLRQELDQTHAAMMSAHRAMDVAEDQLSRALGGAAGNLVEMVAALIAERDEARAEVDRVWGLLTGARTAARRLTSVLIASARYLDQPYTDDPRTPWTAYVNPRINSLWVALGMRGAWPASCACDLHGRNCEPPSELCCEQCSEAQHPAHADGSMCSAPDLSGNHMPTAVEMALRDEVVRLSEARAEARAELVRVGICGSTSATTTTANHMPPFACDLPAGHAGWHGCNTPGTPGWRTSWSYDDNGFIGVGSRPAVDADALAVLTRERDEAREEAVRLRADREWECKRANEAAQLSAEARDRADDLAATIEELSEDRKAAIDERDAMRGWAYSICERYGLGTDQDEFAAIRRYIDKLRREATGRD